MSLQRMDTLLIQARKNKMAIGAFECWDSLNIQAIAIAASRTKTPVILQATPMEYGTMGGADALADIARFYVKKYDIDAALHLDHGGTLEQAEDCVRNGFTSVMLDASTLPFEENLKISAEAAKIAHDANASCEAELGHVGGGDGGDGSESVLTIPGEAADFVKRSGIDCLAVAIGTVHGEYRGTPCLRLDRLEEIASSVSVPLVLHGGSGTPDEQLKAAIKLGINKINICTDISKAFIRAIKENTRTPSLAGKFYEPVIEATAEKTASLIRLFRAEN